ncbi:hypothetical protein EDC96DRAFT_479673 [Choanephora cucurbitarum]|nr:hypothetical protein EDC96DRAFT_479673 [Choanephora cucurbitarum]
MNNTTFETLEHQTAPESTRGLFDFVENKHNRDSAPVPARRRGSVDPQPSRSRPLSLHQPQDRGGHQRSRSASASDLVFQSNGRRNNFALQTLIEEEDAQKRKKDVDLDSIQDMINTLKNLPPLISHPPNGPQSPMIPNSGAHGGGHYSQVTNNKRVSYSNSKMNSDNMDFFFDKRRSSRSSDSLFDNTGPIFFHDPFSRDDALAEAEAKLIGTFGQKRKENNGSRRNSLHTGPPPTLTSRRYSESQSFDTKGASNGLMSRRTSLHTLHESSPGRRIMFNKPLNLTSSNKTEPTDFIEHRRPSTGNHPRRLSRNLEQDWRTPSSGNNSPTLSSFQIVPFTPTRVNFARDDANPHQRRPLFIAHLPFSALPPLFRSRQLSRGLLRVNKRNRSDAYVYCEDLDEDIYICGSRDRNRALEGDIVAVRLVDVTGVLREKKEKEEAKLARNGGQAKARLPDEEDENEIIFGGDDHVDVVKPKYCGVVVAILERAQNQVFSGTLTLIRPNNKRAQEEKAAEEARKSIHGKDAIIQKEAPRIVWFKSTDKRVPLIAIPIEQAPADFVDHWEKYNTRLFVGSIKRWPITSLHPFGTLERELGSAYELSTQTKAIFADNNVTHTEFSEAVLSCLPSLPFKLESDPSRRDLRDDTVTFTIDPKGSNVLDDALSIKKIEGGLWEIGVHVCDIGYFIKSHSPLDKEARARAVRVDLIHTHVPMIPEILTEQVTNLIPNESRYTFSVIWKMDTNGSIVDTWFGKTIIRSSAQLTYEDAQKLLDNPTDENPVSQSLSSLYELYKVLHAARKANGLFTQMRDHLEYEFEKDEQKPVTVSLRHKKPTEMMVKEFLFLANKSVAQKISSQFPEQALLRRHAPPSERKINDLAAYAARHFGVTLDTRNAATLEASIESIHDSKLRRIVSIIVLKTFQPPKYFCTGSLDISRYAHYSLNVPLFTHFTAPSRRFADVIVHRQLEAAIAPGEHTFALEKETIQKLAQHCNIKKEAAIYARSQSSTLFLSVHMHELAQQQQQQLTTSEPESALDNTCGASVIFREAIVVATFDQYFDVVIPELNLEKRIHLACLPVWRSDYNPHNQSLTMFWRKGVDTSTGKKSEWTLSDEEDEEDIDEEGLLEEMNNNFENPVDELDAGAEEVIVSQLAVRGKESFDNSYANNQDIHPNKSVSTPALMNGRPDPIRSTSRRASVVRARLSDSTAYSTEQGFQTIKALDKIRVVLITELGRTPPVIRILAANPFS